MIQDPPTSLSIPGPATRGPATGPVRSSRAASAEPAGVPVESAGADTGSEAPFFLRTAWRRPGDRDPSSPVIIPAAPGGTASEPGAERPGAWRSVLEPVALGIAGVLTVLIPVSVWAEWSFPARAPLAVLFLLLVPGVPLVLALRVPDGRMASVLAPCVGLAVVMISGTAMSTGGGWSSPTAVSIQAALSAVTLPFAGAAVLGRRSGRRPFVEVGRQLGRRWPNLAVLAGSFLLWWAATNSADLTTAGATGIIAVIPWTYWFALLLTGGVLAAAIVGRRLDQLSATLGAATLAVQLLAFGGVAAGAGGPGAGWVHVGFIEAISRSGSVMLGTDARFSWPGFLSGSAHLLDWADLPSAAPLLIWAPAAFALLAMPGIFAIGRAVTGSDRGGWVAVVVMVTTNWMQQDYYSSQAVAFLTYVAILATLTTLWSGAPVPAVRSWWQTPRRIPGRPAGVGPGTLIGLELVLVLLIAGMVLSHQLTPLVTIGALVVTVVTGSTRLRGLPLAALALFVGWFSYGASDYWIGHLESVVGDVGQVGTSVSAGVTERLSGDPAYLQLQYLRIGWTALLVLIAGSGLLVLLWRRRRGVFWWAGLSVVPATLVVLQSYGGEVVLRVAVYGSPIWSALAAVVLLAGGRFLLSRRERLLLPLTVVLVVVGAGMLTLTRGLNVAFERTSPVQVEAAAELLALVPAGSTIGVLDSVGPLPMAGVGAIVQTDFNEFTCDGPVLECAPEAVPDYLYATAPMGAKGVLQGGKEIGWDTALLDDLLATGRWTALLRTPEVTVLAHLSPTSDGQR